MKKTVETKVNAKRLAAYSVAGVAALTSGTNTAEAEITVVESGVVVDGDNETFTGELTGGASFTLFQDQPGSVYFDVLGDLDAKGLAGAGAGAIYGYNLASGVNLSTVNFESNRFGANIASEGGDSPFTIGESGFLGFSFDVGSGVQFGWAEITRQPGDVNPFTIERFAFGDADEAVSVGQTTAVPEPSSLGLLALGAVGVLSTRRRKKTALAN